MEYRRGRMTQDYRRRRRSSSWPAPPIAGAARGDLRPVQHGPSQGQAWVFRLVSVILSEPP